VLLGAVPAPRSDAATDRLAQAETNPGAAAPPPRVAVTAPPDVSLVPRQRPRQATVAINLDEVPDLEPQAASPDAGTALDDAPTTPALRSASWPAVARREARRREQLISRTAPVITLLALGAAALAVFEITRPRAVAAGFDAPAGDATANPLVEIAARRAIVGLSDENKDAVLQLCWRVSDNPTTECRLGHLEQAGEYPPREVAFAALRVQAREVSNAEYEACVKAGTCSPRTLAGCGFYSIAGLQLGVAIPDELLEGDRPATCVTYDEAAAWCAAHRLRLPTAAEWEDIARGGTDRLLPWGRVMAPALMNWGERDMSAFPIPGRLDGAEFAAAVDDYPDSASPEGVVNLLGNVAEWVQPRASDGSGKAGVRGGSYVDDVRTLRATHHVSLETSKRRTTVGFRCVEGPVTPWPEGSGG
jgi:formylglycine-generating enzyme required for sulfatase activity